MAEIINATNFDEKVKNGGGAVLVDFYADWCGPCKMMAPILEKLSDNFTVYKVNTDADGALAAGFGIVSIPTLILFKNGAEVDRMIGVTPEEVLREKLAAL